MAMAMAVAAAARRAAAVAARPPPTALAAAAASVVVVVIGASRWCGLRLLPSEAAAVAAGDDKGDGEAGWAAASCPWNVGDGGDGGGPPPA